MLEKKLDVVRIKQFPKYQWISDKIWEHNKDINTVWKSKRKRKRQIANDRLTGIFDLRHLEDNNLDIMYIREYKKEAIKYFSQIKRKNINMPYFVHQLLTTGILAYYAAPTHLHIGADGHDSIEDATEHVEKFFLKLKREEVTIENCFEDKRFKTLGKDVKERIQKELAIGKYLHLKTQKHYNPREIYSDKRFKLDNEDRLRIEYKIRTGKFFDTDLVTTILLEGEYERQKRILKSAEIKVRDQIRNKEINANLNDLKGWKKRRETAIPYSVIELSKVTRLSSENYYQSIDRLFSYEFYKDNTINWIYKKFKGEKKVDLNLDFKRSAKIINSAACIKLADRIANSIDNQNEDIEARIKTIDKNLYLINKVNEQLKLLEEKIKTDEYEDDSGYGLMWKLKNDLIEVNNRYIEIEINKVSTCTSFGNTLRKKYIRAYENQLKLNKKLKNDKYYLKKFYERKAQKEWVHMVNKKVK